MSFRSRAKKIKPENSVRKFKLVHSINRRGADTLTTEEVKTPKHESKKASSSTHHNHSSSPKKRSKLEASDVEAIPFHLEGMDMFNKRQTLVLLLP
jgi:hypothetical protein